MEIYDAGGALQVSTAFLSYFCRVSGSGTTVAGIGGNTNPSSLVVTVSTYVNPIVAFITPYNMAITGRDGSNNLVFASSAPIGTVVTYFIFDQSNNLPASHVGLELYNASGQIVFNTASHPMLALQAMVSPTGSAVTFTGKTVAIAPMAFGGHRKAGFLYCNNSGSITIYSGSGTCPNVQYQNDGKVYGGHAATDTVTPGVVSWDDVKISCGTGTSYTVPPNYVAPVTILAIDVTGIPLATTFF